MQKAIRAVAQTNGKNKIAIIIPCHRVIEVTKALSGILVAYGERNGYPTRV